MSWGAVAGAAIGVVGSSMSGKKDSSSSTKQELDPRFASYLYGDEEGKNKGLLSDAYDLYSANKTGLNDQMRQGLNSQWATYTDPANMAGYRQMFQLGSGLMSAPVMGNPFADGRSALYSAGGNQGGPNLGMGGGQPAPRPVSYTADPGPAMPQAPGPFTAPPPPPPLTQPEPVAAQPTTWEDMYNQNKLPTIQAPPGTDWNWIDGMWNARRYET